MATKEQAIGEAPVRGVPVEGAEGRRSALAIGLSLVSLYLIWGSTYLAISFGVQSFPPFMMGGIRFLTAGVLLYTFLRLRGHRSPTRAQWMGAAVVGMLLLIGGNGLVIFAEQWVASGLSALVIATTPLWTALFSGLWGKWPAKLEWVGLALGFSGVAILSMESDIQSNPLGAIALFIAPIAWSFGSIWSKRLPMPQGMMSSATEMLVAGVVFFIISLGLGERLTVMPSALSIGAVAYLIVFGSLIAFSAYVYLLTHVRATIATTYAYINPIVAVALGAWLASEHITWTTVAAMAVILSGVGVLGLVRRDAH